MSTTPARLQSPLSYGQQGLWFLYHLFPDNPAYNVSIPALIRQDLNIPALQHSFQRLVDRHAALRTVFTFQDGEAVQITYTHSPVYFKQIDASSWEDSELYQTVQREAQQALRLEYDALFQVHLFTRHSHEHILLLKFHHIITDFASNGILLKELGQFYHAECKQQPIELEPIPAQYSDFVHWQLQMVQSREGQQHQEFWKTHLGSTLSPLPLPTQTTHRFIDTQAPPPGGIHVFHIDTVTTQRLKQIAQAEATPLSALLLAGFSTLLYRYTGYHDIPIGTFFHGRSQATWRRTVGYFINTMLIRTHVEGRQSFKALVASIQQTLQEGRKHGDYPISLVTDQLQQGQDVHNTSPLQILFNMVRAFDPMQKRLMLFTRGQSGGSIHLDGLLLESYPIGLPWAQFDLSFTVEDDKNELYASLEYNKHLFSDETMRSMATHLQTILNHIATSSDTLLQNIPLLSETELHRQLVLWNDTTQPYPTHQCLHQLIEQQVQRTPERIAIQYGTEKLTYAELDTQANQLAHHLRSLEVTADSPVGVCIDRSLALPVAILAILKAGGAFLPLDTTMPALRIQQLLHSAQASICLYADTPPELLTQTFTIVQVHEHTSFSSYPITAPPVTVVPDNLISIYYTSGSTGQPKGVASTHRGWVSRMIWMQEHYQLQADETVLQKTTMTFDDSAVEVFWPLLVGARVVLLAPDEHKDPQAILQASIQHQVAVLHFVPSMLALFVDAIEPHHYKQLQHLRIVISSGEALRAELVRRFKEKVSAGLYNQYGATEVSIDSTLHICSAEDTREDAIVPVGRPISNHRAYILDTNLQPVPIGVYGEVYLAGEGLARGYLHDPVRTALAFIPSPFEHGGRLYKTGDFARYRPDGSILFHGRTDDQVKIRGQRVELAEIEAIMATHPVVQECAILAFKRKDGYRLVAYYLLSPQSQAPSQPPASTEEELRTFLHQRLPDYMVPGRFVHMERFPLTSSGKLHRQQLPDPGEERPALAQGYSAPTTETEQTITTIWQQVLDVSPIGIHDTFFDLGGHSLDMTRVISRINQALRVQLPLKTLMQYPTIAGLAHAVLQAQHTQEQKQTKMIPLRHHREQETYGLSHAQKRQWFAYQLDPQSAHGALFSIDIVGPLNTKRFALAWQAFIQRHSILRTTYTESDGVPQQEIQYTDNTFYQQYDLAQQTAEAQQTTLQRIARTERQHIFDLHTLPLIRATLFTLAEQHYRLLVTAHPMVLDGWGTTILLSDLQALYQTFDEHGHAVTTLPPAYQYIDYAIWHNENLTHAFFNEQHRYWLKQLQDDVPPPALPADFSAPPVHVEPMRYRVQPLPNDSYKQLQQMSTQQGTTLYVLLLTGLQLWLARLSGQQIITVGSPVSGRSTPELEQIFGVLTNTVALRTILDGNPSCLEAIQRVHHTTMDALAHQDYPFDLIIQDRRQRQKTQTLYSVVFVLQNASKYQLTQHGLSMHVSLTERLMQDDESSSEFIADPTTTYDLHIEVREIEQQLSFVTQYNNLRFKSETVDHFLHQLISILTQMIDNPHQRLSQLELVDNYDLDTLFA